MTKLFRRQIGDLISTPSSNSARVLKLGHYQQRICCTSSRWNRSDGRGLCTSVQMQNACQPWECANVSCEVIRPLARYVTSFNSLVCGRAHALTWQRWIKEFRTLCTMNNELNFAPCLARSSAHGGGVYVCMGATLAACCSELHHCERRGHRDVPGNKKLKVDVIEFCWENPPLSALAILQCSCVSCVGCCCALLQLDPWLAKMPYLARRRDGW